MYMSVSENMYMCAYKCLCMSEYMQMYVYDSAGMCIVHVCTCVYVCMCESVAVRICMCGLLCVYVHVCTCA